MSKTRHFSFGIKSLAVILSVLTVLLSLPLTVFADDIRNFANKNNEPDRSEGESGVFSSYSLVELEDERDQNTKVIRDSNGKTTVAEYGMPVHIQNVDGKWENIDNTLSDKGDHYLTGNTDISIAKEICNGSDVFSLDNGRITVSLPADTQIKNTAGCVVEYEKPSEERTDFEKLTTLDNLTSAVRYKDVLRSTDFVYTVNPYGVKQEIVVSKRTESYSYSFDVRTDGLILNTDESGNILASDVSNGDLVYILPAPFAYDSSEHYTDPEQCFYTLTDNGEGNYTVTVSVDPEWMDTDERCYPVTIDPTIYHGGYRKGNMRDSIISQNYPNNNYGTKTYLKAGYDSANANTIIYVAPWSLPSIPAGSYISDAQLNLTANGTNNFSSGKLNLVAKKIIHSGYSTIWGETTVCWNTGCTYGDILDYNDLSAPSSGTVVSWNITSAVRDWYNDSSTFQGIAVMQYNTSSTASKTIQFHASESTTIGDSYRPFFTFSFVSTLGVEDYYSYFSSDAGLAGTGYVNASTGALTLSKALLSTTDSLFPYTVNLVYNSKLANKTYTYYDFSAGTTDWQFVCGNFKTRQVGLVYTIDIFCEYSKQPSGYALFDNISVVESTNDSVVEYEYYDSSAGVKEGLLRAKTAGYYTESYEYDSNRQLTRTANNRGEINDYLHNGSTVNEVTVRVILLTELILRVVFGKNSGKL